MRATKAYIASLGTTGLLLAFSASLLVVVGALFAFNTWPGSDIRHAVDSLVVDDDNRPFGVAGPEQVALDAAPAAIAVASAPAPGVGATLGAAGGDAPATEGGFVNGGDDIGGGNTPTGGGGGGTTPSGDPIDIGRNTNQLADGTEQITGDLGRTVGGVNQGLGDTVSETGQALSEIVRGLPDVNVGRDGVDVGGGGLKLGD